MKKIAFIIILFFSYTMLSGQITQTIGTGTTAQSKPFGMWYGYERSAALYLYSEIGSYAMLNSLGWYVETSDPTSCPTKIYLKITSDANLTNLKSWASMISGATLVYNASTGFQTTGWQTLDVADFAYTSGTNNLNLLVLCETNYGGVGATTYPTFRYTYVPNAKKHQVWQGDDTPPTGLGTVNDNRPNIQITYTSFIPGNPVPPSGFMAAALSSSQVSLSWIKNLANDNVMVAVNTADIFGTPSGSYSPGDILSGGGTVIYNGSGTNYTQTTGLDPGTTYYYRAWSVQAPVPTYSPGTGSSATTFCIVASTFPFSTDFESVSFPPVCWSLAGLPWTRSSSASGYGNGSGSTSAGFFTVTSGNFDLISPELDLSSLTNPEASFDHAYATYSNQVDKLELWYSINNGSSFTLLNTWLGGISGPLNTGGATTSLFVPTASQWGTKSYALPAGTNRVMFRGVSLHGNNLYLDNIIINEACVPPISLATTYIGDTTADLTWSSGSSSWEILWGDAGFDTLTAGTLITSVTSNPYTLGGLSQMHSYDFYVRSTCGSSPTAWAGPLNFTTICGIVSTPYAENFDGFTPPSTGCLAVTNNNGDSHEWVTSTLHPRSSPNSMYIGKNTSTPMDDWFFTPQMELAEGTTYVLEFYYRGGGSTEKLEVEWGLYPDATGMTLGQLWNNASITSSTYTQATALVAPSATGYYYIGWHGYSANNKQYICVDDITVSPFITWTGSVSTNWNTASNWYPAIVPQSSLNVIIPGGLANFPVISTSGLACNHLTINSGASLIVNTSMKYTINGNLTIQDGASLNIQGSVILKGSLDNQNSN